jgi:integrase
MAHKKRVKVPGYVGIYAIDAQKGGRISGKAAADVSYYARIKESGKLKDVFLGRKSDGVTPAQAANMRARITAGAPVDLPKPRGRKKATVARLDGEGLTDSAADGYQDPETRPAEYWTVDRLWDAYVEAHGGPRGWSAYVTDRAAYVNHLRPLVGALRPVQVTDLRLRTVREKIGKKWAVCTGRQSALDATRRKLAAAKDSARKATGKAQKEKHQARAAGLAARLDDIKRTIKATRRRLHPGTVERCVEILRRLINFGADNDLCPPPARRLKVRRIDDEKTEDLTPDQIGALLDACDQDVNQDVADMLRLALLSGLRRGSIFGLVWRNINFQKNLITIKSIDGRRHSKSGRQLKIRMSPAAKRILEARAAVADRSFSEYVFPGRSGGKRYTAQKAARRIATAAGLPDDFRPFHGLRHAFASNLANNGVDLYIIGRLLGHSPNSPTMTQRYSHLRDDALRAATDIMSDIVDNSRPADAGETKKTGQGEN